MTTYEHAMLGICQALGLGLHHRHGWRPAALAGALAVVPDWDGLTLVCGLGVFDRAHRAWGHSLFVCAAVGIVLSAADYRLDLVGRGGRWLARWLSDAPVALRGADERSWSGCALWLAVGLVASLSHLPEDLVISGAAQLTHWELKLLWPFSDRGFVYPLVPWGDPGVSVILVGAMFAMWRWRFRVQSIAATAIVATSGYLVARGLLR